jgi:arylsulfatase A-like enzyme
MQTRRVVTSERHFRWACRFCHPAALAAAASATLGLVLAGCDGPDRATPPHRDAPTSHNFLVLLTDDQGIDKVGAYGAHPNPPPTPNMDALAAEGVLFRRAYANPTCSPTRAALMTGRYNSRYGVGQVIFTETDAEQLPRAEVTIAEALTGAGYHSEALGKWHLASNASEDGPRHPLVQGFAHHAGSFGNLVSTSDGEGDGPATYFHWEKLTDGAASRVTTYATTDTVDDAIDRMGEMPEPWFLYVAFNAPHEPYTHPPEELHDYELTDDSPIDRKHAAMVQSLDTEIGRLLGSMSPALRRRTTIVLASDNGTPTEAVSEPWRATQCKNSPYEGGIRVPLVVSGAAVVDPGRETDALVHVVDLLPTLVELAGLDPAALTDAEGEPVELDGVSFLPQLREPAAPGARSLVYSGKFGPNGPPDEEGRYRRFDWDIVLDERWKLVRRDEALELYDLHDPDPVDGLEGRNVLEEALTAEAESALARLTAELAAIEARAAYVPTE